jgi:hypothetical protein
MRDILSKGTCPEGDDRDTPIGGVSRLSPVPSVGSVPGLLVIESPTDLDGEPCQEWAWDLGVETGLFGVLFPGPYCQGSTETLSPPQSKHSRDFDGTGKHTHLITHQRRVR